MVGPALMVAPVVDQGITTRTVLLPAAATWYDAKTGDCHTPQSTVPCAC
jgi:alpha-D-xyloside xylohydrolase